MTNRSIRAASPLRAAVSRALLAASAVTSACLVAPSAFAQQRASTLTPNQQSISNTLEDLCFRLTIFSGEGVGQFAAKLAAPEDDLTDQCNSFVNAQVPFDQIQGAVFDALNAEEFNSLRTVTAVFSQTQFETAMDRLRKRRSEGSTSAGITSSRNTEMVVDNRRLLGGGAAADDTLLADRLGLWVRGNSGSGDKDATINDGGFDADQWGATVGADYRFGSALVVGASVGAGSSKVDFRPTGGNIDIDSIAGSVYGGLYLNNFYVDAVVNYITGDYESQRHVQYTDGFGGAVNQNFLGSTDGETVSAGLAAGYDFAIGGFTLTPSVGYLQVDVSIDGFRESDGPTNSLGYGMSLAFDDQDYKSSSAQATLDATYAWNMSWGVLIPHVRAGYVEEFEDGVEVLGVRFANDPFVGTSNPTPPITITSDEIDSSYLRLAVGASAQFRGSVSGYLEYQRIEGFDNVEFQDFTIGVRMQF